MSSVTITSLADAFNEWMRRYIDKPERFEQEWQTVGKVLAEKAAGQTPSYGAQSAAYVETILSDLAIAIAKRPCRKPDPPPAPPNKDTQDGKLPHATGSPTK